MRPTRGLVRRAAANGSADPAVTLVPAQRRRQASERVLLVEPDDARRGHLRDVVRAVADIDDDADFSHRPDAPDFQAVPTGCSPTFAWGHSTACSWYTWPKPRGGRFALWSTNATETSGSLEKRSGLGRFTNPATVWIAPCLGTSERRCRSKTAAIRPSRTGALAPAAAGGPRTPPPSRAASLS